MSRAVVPFDDLHLRISVGKVAIRNRRLDLNSIVVRTHGYFCQFLEGRSTAIVEAMGQVRRSEAEIAVKVILDEVPLRRSLDSSCFVARSDIEADCVLKSLHEQLEYLFVDPIVLLGTLAKCEVAQSLTYLREGLNEPEVRHYSL